MDLFGKFRKLDSSLQRGLDNGFARVFGGEVVPAEIDETLKQQVENSVMMDPDGNRWAPCHFVVNISQRDFDSLNEKHSDVEDDLSDRLQRFIRNSGWRTNSPVQVIIQPREGMHSGQLKADSMFNAPPRSESRSEARSESRPDSSREQDRRDEWETHRSDESGENWDDANSAPSSEGYHGAGYDQPHDSSERNQQSYDSLKSAHDEQQERDRQVHAEAAGAAGAGAAGATAAAAGAASAAASSASPELSDIVKPAPSSNYVWDNPAASQAHSAEGAELASEEKGADQHPGESAYATDPLTNAPAQPTSYPGTEVLAHNVYKEDPRTGASSDRNETHAEVTLILRDGSDRRHVLREGSNVIGRGNGVDLRIPDTGVSRQHAEISWDGYDAVLTDLQSTNGTSVNDTPIENWLLADGDLIVMGHSEIEVQFR